MTPTRPAHFPEMSHKLVSHEVCSRAVDRLLYNNTDPNEALNSSSGSNPWYDESFAFPSAFYWEDMLAADDSSQVSNASQSSVKRISEVYDSSYSMWGYNGVELIDPNQGYIGDCWIIAAASCVA